MNETIFVTKCCLSPVYFEDIQLGFEEKIGCSRCNKVCELVEVCAYCLGTGEIAYDEDDGEGHSARGVDVQPCRMCRDALKPIDGIKKYHHPYLFTIPANTLKVGKMYHFRTTLKNFEYKPKLYLTINGKTQLIKPMKKYKVLKGIVRILFWSAVIASFITAMIYGVNKSEVVRCNELVKQASEGYTNFYISTYENQVCQAHGIIINAPIATSTK